MLKKERKIRIALLNEVEGTVDIEGYKTAVRNAVNDRCKDLDIEIVCLAGGAWKRSPYNLQEPQRNILYTLIQPNQFDGVILVFTVTSYSSSKENTLFYSYLEGLPVVTIGLTDRDYSSVSVNNSSGIISMVDHMVKKHGFRNMAYIGGPMENWEASQRLKAFRKALINHGIEPEEQRIFEGDFLSPSGEAGARKFLNGEKHPQAIICANDHMAIGVIRELKRQHINVPQEIAVVGFDNSEKADVINPPLTTISQPYRTMGRKAVDLLMGIINGEVKTNEHHTIAPELVVRSSCSCLNPSIRQLEEIPTPLLSWNEIEKELIELSGDERLANQTIQLIQQTSPTSPLDTNRQILDNLRSMLIDSAEDDLDSTGWNGLFTQIYYRLNSIADHISESRSLLFQQIRLIISEVKQSKNSEKHLQVQSHQENMQNFSRMIFRCISLKEIIDHLDENLKFFGILHYGLFLYPSALINKGDHLPIKAPEEIFRVSSMGRNSELALNFQKHKAVEILDRKFTENLTVDSFLVEPLFSGEQQIGILNLHQGVKESAFYESLRNALSASLFQIHTQLEKQRVAQSLRDTLAELEKSNQKLGKISHHDPLTGLYNRRGFFSHVKHSMALAKRERRSCLMIYGDMDRMKPINDRFGHNEGDRAICEFAAALKSVSRKSDALSRVGGDEFLLFAYDSSLKDFPSIQDRIEQDLKRRNNRITLDYSIEASFGAVELDPASQESLDELIQRADKAQYIIKKGKKAAR